MINIKMQPNAVKEEVQKLSPKILVIGVGGAGGNAVNNMISSGLEGCEFMVCNTDAQALEYSLSSNKIQLGASVTGGLGAGSKPEVGQAAAEETLQELMGHLEGANMAFVTAGMGGGTGTGAAPVIAKACREKGILTVGVVTKPFHFEGAHRMKLADAGIEEMQDYVDTLIVIPNQNLFRIANEKTTFSEAFQMADSVLQAGVRGVTDLMVRPGLVNLDFADIRTAMLEMGKAMMGTGEADGDKRAIEAAEAAINNPLLDDVSMKGARGVIINVTGGYDMTLFEADEACNRIRDEVDPDANIIFGATFDESCEGAMRVSIVATGIDAQSEMRRRGGAGLGSSGVTRTKPNMEAQSSEASSDTAAQLASGGAAPTSQHQATAAVMPVSEIVAPSTQSAEVPSSSDAEADMFEQRSYSDTTGSVPSNTALRGSRYKNAFIPPKPMDIQAADSHVAPAMLAPSAPAIATPTENISASTGSSLNLTPPRMPHQQQRQQQRTPSLFERITGAVQNHLGDTPKEEQATPVSGGSFHEATPSVSSPASLGSEVVPADPSQGSLNIDSPSSEPKSGGDDLDIPAFLRRQAN